MNLDSLKLNLAKIPVELIVVLVIGYFGYDYYQFMNSDDSPLLQAKSQVTDMKTQRDIAQKKVREAEDFFRTLEVKKAELRSMARQLDEVKASLTENLDVPAFMKMVITEARKVRLNVTSLRPSGVPIKKEHYAEQVFELKIKGIYAQILVFLDRMSQAQRLVRVDHFNLKPADLNAKGSRFVELEGSVDIKTYYYLGSRADEVVKSPGDPAHLTPTSSASAPAPAAAPPTTPPGGPHG